jgi:hypothetical protein
MSGRDPEVAYRKARVRTDAPSDNGDGPEAPPHSDADAPNSSGRGPSLPEPVDWDACSVGTARQRSSWWTTCGRGVG